MEWVDEGIVLGTRRHGEANAILEVMTRDHGRHLGLVRGGGGARLRPILQPGNRVGVTWRARLDEHLGVYTVEGLALHAGRFLTEACALYGMTYLAALCRLLPERDPHGAVAENLEAIILRFGEPRFVGPQIARFELQMLTELGFGLELDRCAATGSMENLIYVSPRTGRAVSEAAGAPWADRLLRLPDFLLDDEGPGNPSSAELAAGFAMTGFFLDRHVLEPRGLAHSDARAHFIAALSRLWPGATGSAE